MSDLHPIQKKLLDCISEEMSEQEERYSAKEHSSLKQLKANRVALHPLTVTRKTFGYADYPEISFRLPFFSDTFLFKENSAIECFLEGEDSVKGILIRLNGQQGTFRLFAPDFPDWIEDSGVGIKLSPDHRTSDLMKEAVMELSNPSKSADLFKRIHGEDSFGSLDTNADVKFSDDRLNDSQQSAVRGMVSNEDLLVLHGPPGTGKTTTLVEGIVQLIDSNKKVIGTAPSNAAVDNLAKQLINRGVKILRVGNSLKVDSEIFVHTPEGKMLEAKEHKEIKKLKIRAEELRKLSYQYKRNFGKEEREQRKLLIREVKSLRKEIRDIQDYFDSKLYENADIILGTPIGLKGFLPEDAMFDCLVFDEAGQAIEPLAWVVFPHATSWILAGDPFQLPPTVLSQKAKDLGFDVSILETSFRKCQSIHFLDTQYRMEAPIAEFSNQYFYSGKLKTPEVKQTTGVSLVFIDTAGTGFEEKSGAEGTSLMNEGELTLVEKIMSEYDVSPSDAAFISPYSGQVQLAKNELPNELSISTIDSFQGQEKPVIIVSLVRSNSDGVIGFLKDYRRMNVALTRAKDRLIVIGDSATIGQDPFYAQFLSYAEDVEGYRSAWELM